MPASQRASSTRRPILRFELASISIDDRPNVYKNPQLVLKPQLELAPRRPYTGSRPRAPVWHHFLMVHVKDKADELVKLDLAIFKPSSTDVSLAAGSSITCLSSRSCLVFQCLKGAEKGSSSTLSTTFRQPFDLETVLRELDNLGLHIEYEQATREHNDLGRLAALGSWVPLERTISPLYRPSSTPLQLNSSNPRLVAIPGSQNRYATYPESQSHGALLRRPPSQPTGQSAGLQGPRPWSPAFVPSRPATTLGLPGILGEGIYKVSKIGPTVSSRPRVRRTSTVLQQQAPKLYTVSKHFDKTLGAADILQSSGGRHLSRGPSSALPLDNPAEYPSRSPSVGAPEPDKPFTLRPERPITPLTRMSSISEGVAIDSEAQTGLRRLRTLEDASGSSQPVGSDDREHHFSLPSVLEGKVGYSLSQPEPATRVVRTVADDGFLFSSSPTLLGPRSTLGLDDDWLLQVAQVQHQGLCEASRVWDEFMEKADIEVAAAEGSGDLPDVLSKLEGEFARRWEGVVTGTMEKMRGVRAGGYNL